jgi:hypothetical protein
VCVAAPGIGHALIDVPASSAPDRTIGVRYLKGRQACDITGRIVLPLD